MVFVCLLKYIFSQSESCCSLSRRIFLGQSLLVEFDFLNEATCGWVFRDQFRLTYVGQSQFRLDRGARCSGDSGARVAHHVSLFLVFLSCFLASSVPENYRFGDPSMFVGLIS